MARSIDDWSVAKIKRAGGDAVKVLAWYRPDADPGVLEHQQRYVADIGEECRRHDILFVFELLVYPMAGAAGHTTDYVEAEAWVREALSGLRFRRHSSILGFRSTVCGFGPALCFFGCRPSFPWLLQFAFRVRP